MLVVGGGAVVAASLIADDVAVAIVMGVLYIAFAIGAYFWAGGSGDVAAIMRVGGDERQRSLDRDATIIAGYCMVFAALTGAVVQIARARGPRRVRSDVRGRRGELRGGALRAAAPPLNGSVRPGRQPPWKFALSQTRVFRLFLTAAM